MTAASFIRPVRNGDFEAWLSLWDGYNAFYGRSGPTALASDVTAATWSRFFDPYEPMHGLVASLDDRLVGLVHYLFHRTTTAIAPNCYLQDLFAVPALRGRGIGRALIEAVYEQVRRVGGSRVYWQTHETNQTAMKLYDRIAERTGFVVYARNVAG